LGGFWGGQPLGGDVSPILVRPVREQLEHDRVIRLLPGRYKRRFDVGINPGAEQNAAIGVGTSAVYPDAVLYSTEKNRKIQGVVEVETVESINHLEVMSQWGPYSRLKIPFHLYVPVAALDVARRLSSDHHVAVSEIWSYDNVGDQVRFTLVHKVPETSKRSIAAPPPAPAPAKTAPPVKLTPGKPSPVKPGAGKVAVVKPADARPAEVKPVSAKPAAVKATGAKPAVKPVPPAGKSAAVTKLAPPPAKPAPPAAKPVPPTAKPAAAKSANPARVKSAKAAPVKKAAPKPSKAARPEPTRPSSGRTSSPAAAKGSRQSPATPARRAPAAARSHVAAPASKSGGAPRRK
jgi:hypothetical protein